jgi:hypothetical protein
MKVVASLWEMLPDALCDSEYLTVAFIHIISDVQGNNCHSPFLKMFYMSVHKLPIHISVTQNYYCENSSTYLHPLHVSVGLYHSHKKYTFCLTPNCVKTGTHSNKFRRRQHVTETDTTSNSEHIQTLKIYATLQIFILYNKMSTYNSHIIYKCHKCRPHTKWTEFTTLYHLWCTLHPHPLYTLPSCYIKHKTLIQ